MKAFESINTEELFNIFSLPLKNNTEINESNVINRAFEIDLSSKTKLKKCLNVTKLDCVPILYVLSNPDKTPYTVTF